jgi:PAS domain S-box-containing protein
MSRPIQVLFVEDSEQDTALAVRELNRYGFEVDWERVDDQPGLERALDERRWDVILADQSMPGFDALRALDTVRGRDSDVPYVIVSGTIGEELAVRAMRAGAQDYVLKDRMARLGAVVDRELREAQARAEQRRAKEALRESEARKTAIFEASLDALITLDHLGRIVEFNPAAERMFGYPATSVLGHDLAEVIFPSHLRGTHREGLASFLSTGEGAVMYERVDLPAMRRDRSMFPVEMTVVRVDRPVGPLYTSFIRDVTARHRLETRQQLLSDAGARLIETMDRAAMLQGVAELTVDGIAHWCAFELVEPSGALCRVALATRPDGPFSDHTEPALPTGLARAVVDTRQPRRGALDVEDGALSYVAAPLVARGVALGVMILALESWIRKLDGEDQSLAVELAARCASAVENAALFEQVQASVRARDEFIAVAAHELRTPLTPLWMQAQALAAQLGAGVPPSGERLEVTVRQIVRSTERLVSLAEMLLDVSLITVGRFDLEREPVDLGALVGEVVESLRDELASTRTTVIWTGPPPPVTGDWDRRRLAQAIRSVVDNAIKFGSGQPIELSLASGGDTARLALRDHGPGLSPEQKATLMDRFYRSAPIQHHGGFGVGLWLVRRVVEAHDGHLEVWSEPGDGACFTMVLPTRLEPRAEQPPAGATS